MSDSIIAAVKTTSSTANTSSSKASSSSSTKKTTDIKQQFIDEAKSAFDLGGSVKSMDGFIKQAFDKTGKFKDLDSAYKNLIMEKTMQERNQRVSFMSNITRMFHEAAMAVINNLRG